MSVDEHKDDNERATIIDTDIDPPSRTPEETASIFSIMTVSWLSQLFTTGAKRAIEIADLIYLKSSDFSDKLLVDFSKTWKYQQSITPNNELPSVFKALKSAFGRQMYTALPFYIAYQIMQFAGPIILAMYLERIEASFNEDDNEHNENDIWILAGCLFASYMFATFLIIHYWARVFSVGMRCRGALIAACYEKALKLTLSARGERTTGEILNLITSDCRKIRDVTQFLWVLFIAPCQIILAVYLLYQQIGWSVFVAIGTQILFVTPLQICVGGKVRKLQQQLMKQRDKRFKMVNELFGAMKIVKMYAWEQSFQDNVKNIRENELKILTRFVWWQFFMIMFFLLAPLLVTVISFTFYVVVDGNELTATKAFTSIALFNILRFPMAMLPNVIVGVIEAKVSLKRISRFLNAQEIDPHIIEYITNDNDQYKSNDDEMNDGAVAKKSAITIRNASFSFDDAMEIVALNNINIDFKAGDITMIIGETGSGKSTLLASILGQINKIDGSLMYYESPFRSNENISISFSSQVAWIQNATVRENILFGKAYDEDWYNQVVKACALESDFDQFDHGDMTEIGERGITLSGGQKQRVSLARSVYSNTDCYLFDDPLSAVDPHVGNHIFNECFMKLLRNNGKTVILSTHAISFLKQADKIVVMEQGTVKSQGSLQQLIDAKVNITEFVIQSNNDEDEDDIDVLEPEEIDADEIGPLQLDTKGSRDSNTKSKKRRRSSSGFAVPSKKEIEVSTKKKKEKEGQITEDEERESGEISMQTFKLYFVGIGCCIIFMIFATSVISNVIGQSATFWLAIWADDSLDTSVGFYIGVFFGIQLVMILFTFINNIFLVFARIAASRNLHNSLLIRVIHAPMKFFDTTPIGRIINRFSKDMNNIDSDIPQSFTQFLRMGLWMFSAVISVCIVSWYFALAAIPLFYAYYKLQRYFISTLRELRRLSAIMNSPIYSHFTETLDGINVIQSFGIDKAIEFCKHNRKLVDNDHRTWYPTFMGNRWLSVRLESIANCMIGVAAFMCAFSSPSAGFVGVALSSVMSVTGGLNMVVRVKAQLEQDAVSIERLAQYSNIDQEADFVIEDKTPKKQWPEQGTITFDNVFMKYRENLDYVIKGLSCVINGGEKIGVIGRTGAGKSSLFVTLLRICEYNSDKGKILIDDIDIKEIGLYDLRSRISVIPQDPVLFIGTVRYNLDPFESATDEQLIEALKLSHVYEGLRKMAIEVEIKKELKELREEKKRKKKELREKNKNKNKNKVPPTPSSTDNNIKEGNPTKINDKIRNKNSLKYVTTTNEGDSEREESSSISSSFHSQSSLHAAEFLDDPKYKDVNPLDIIVDENGSNFSVGQRQLLCLARAIIRKSRIILLDEATSAVDHHTDKLIQETIRDVFKNNTILTIAHRIDTILDYDKILIMDQGKILEFDSPNNLLNDKESKFRNIVTESFGVNVEDVINSKSYLTNLNDDVNVNVDIEEEEIHLEIEQEETEDVESDKQDADYDEDQVLVNNENEEDEL